MLDHLLDRLVWYAFRRLREMGDAEDVVQDVLVRAYEQKRREPRPHHAGDVRPEERAG